MSQRDHNLMSRAFREAAQSDWVNTAPNPLVGALALKGGHVVGYGHHRFFGDAHAEEMALESAPEADEMFVTLEPCSSKGKEKKRKPCLETILSSNVKRVVVGAVDPNPNHQGKGIEKLRAEGVRVDVLAFDDFFIKQNKAFVNHLKRDVPFTFLKWASTADGYIATHSGDSKWISNTDSRNEVHLMRSISNGIVAGSGTVAQDMSRLNSRIDRDSLLTTKIILGDSRSIKEDHPIYQDDLTILFSEGNARDVEGVQVFWEELRSKCGMQRLWVEGGSKVFSLLIAAGLSHAIIKYEAPILLGGGTASCGNLGFAQIQNGLRLTDELRKDLGDNLRRAWLVH